MCQRAFAEANHPRARRLPGGGIDSTPFEEGASMRIEDCSNTPSLKHDGRLINSVVRSRKRKRPNALKHGFYAGTPLIPGEDPDEFNKLYAELIDEWKPSGPTLRDAVFELADLRWKQRRLRRFMQTKLSSID